MVLQSYTASVFACFWGDAGWVGCCLYSFYHIWRDANWLWQGHIQGVGKVTYLEKHYGRIIQHHFDNSLSKSTLTAHCFASCFSFALFPLLFLASGHKKHLRKNTRKARIQDYVPFLLVPYECSPLAPLVFFIWCNFLIYPWVNSNRNVNGMKSRHEACANERKAALHAANYLPSTEASVLSRDERKTRLTSPLLLSKKAQQSIESSFQKGSLVICLAAHAPVPNDLSSTTGWPNLHSNESLSNTNNTLSLSFSPMHSQWWRRKGQRKTDQSELEAV